MRSGSNRMIMIGEVDQAKPQTLIKRAVKKDTSRYLRAEDIPGA